MIHGEDIKQVFGALGTPRTPERRDELLEHTRVSMRAYTRAHRRWRIGGPVGLVLMSPGAVAAALLGGPLPGLAMIVAGGLVLLGAWLQFRDA
jgi:hypothetical protein